MGGGFWRQSSQASPDIRILGWLFDVSWMINRQQTNVWTVAACVAAAAKCTWRGPVRHMSRWGHLRRLERQRLESTTSPRVKGCSKPLVSAPGSVLTSFPCSILEEGTWGRDLMVKLGGGARPVGLPGSLSHPKGHPKKATSSPNPSSGTRTSAWSISGAASRSLRRRRMEVREPWECLKVEPSNWIHWSFSKGVHLQATITLSPPYSGFLSLPGFGGPF